MKYSWSGILFLLSLSFSSGAAAYEYEFFDHASMSARASTLGLGGEIKIPLITTNGGMDVGARVGLAGFSYSSSTEQDNVNYNFDFRLLSAYTFFDWHPWGGSFRLTSGIVFNGNEVNIEARPSANGYNFGGTSYLATDVDKVDGKITFNALSPYAGFGWDWHRAGATGWSFSADLGLMYHGSPTADLSADCAAALLAPNCAALRSDVEQEEDDLNESLKNMKWYPVVGFNGTYKF